MNKKLLTLLLFVMAAFTAAFAQETVTVYDGTNTNTYVPVYGTWADAYNKCEFVMNANDLDELPAGSTITGLKWYLSNVPSAAWGGNFQIFIKEIDATTISAFTGTDGATIVWEGALDGTSGEINLEFNNYYTYEGGNLLIGVYQTEKGTYKTSAFYGVSTDGASVSGYSSSALESCSATQRNFVPKTTFTYTPGGGVVYSKPKNLQISDITTNGAVATWEAGGEETAWNLEYKKAADEEWTAVNGLTTASYTFDALANGTSYDVRVQADYGEGQSGWVTASFQTPMCEESDMGEITYVLTDTYGDGWNGNKLQIVAHDTGAVVAELTITTGGKDEPITGTVALCYGVDYDLVWVAGSYGYECGFQVLNPEGVVIYEYQGTGASSGGTPTAGVLTTFQINQVSCARPTALAASNVVYNGATLTWTPGDEEQDAWEVVYGANGFNPDEATPVAVNGEATYTITGLTENTAYQAYVRGNCGANDKSNWSDPVAFTTPLQFAVPTELAVDDITANSAKATWTGDAQSYNLRYRKAGGKEIVLSQDFETSVDGWSIIDADGDGNNWGMGDPSQLIAAHSGSTAAFSASYGSSGDLTPDNWLVSPQIPLKGTLKFWVAGSGSWPETYTVMVSTTDTNVDSFTALTADMTTPSGSGFNWGEVTLDLSAYAGQQGYIAFRHYNCTGMYYMILDDITIEGDDIAAGEWITIENATSPQDIEGLDPLTEYEVQVQGVYADGASQWTESVLFTTLSALDTPTDLAVDNITENSAEASWEGVQESYNLRYRKAATADVLFFESFEDGLDAWTLIDTDGDGNNWMQFDPTTFTSGGFPAYDGTYVVMSRSWMSNALTPDQWMISPKIDDLGGMLRYYVMDDGANYPETYRIYVSTTDTEIDSFTPVTDDMLTPNSVNWTEVAVDLSAYEGQSGYIAFRHYNCTDKDFMLIDAIGIYKNEVPAGEWIVVENVTSPYTIEDLEAATDYEVEVQGIYGEETTEWTAPVKFTTLEATTPEPVITLDVEFGTYTEAQTVHVTVENMPENGVIKYQFVPAPTREEWTDYDEAGIAIDKSGNLTVAVFDAEGEEVARLAGDYIIDNQTGINGIYVDGYDNNAWYNLNGQKLNGKPTAPGIYINGNKKVVIK